MSFFQYGRQDYWDKRYKEDGDTYEWYHKFIDIEPNICNLLSSNKKVLVIGCGNSNLSDDLYSRNIKDVTSIDTSSTAIKIMTAKHGHLKYLEMDVRKMTFEDNQFDIVIDKACMDCIFCGENSFENSDKALNEIYRVLNKQGSYIILSNSSVDHRQPFYQKLKWDIETKKIPKPEMRMVDLVQDKEIPQNYTLFICKKDL